VAEVDRQISTLKSASNVIISELNIRHVWNSRACHRVQKNQPSSLLIFGRLLSYFLCSPFYASLIVLLFVPVFPFFFHSSLISCLSSIQCLSFSLVLFLHLFNFLLFLIHCTSLSSFSLLLFIFHPHPSSKMQFLCRKEQRYLLTSIYSVSSAFERDKEEKTINLWSSECHKKARKDVPSSAKCSLRLSLLGQYLSRKRLHSDICLASISA
jgi:hypothetical protein